MSGIWRRFADGIPEYLARHYWWAYLARPGVWFFDHEPVISLILFGAYRKLVQAALARVDPALSTLMIANVYGGFVPRLAARLHHPLTLVDVAPIQLALARKKASKAHASIRLARMDAARLGFRNGAFAQVIVFFLWHEMPPDARARSEEEAVRVLREGGRLIVVEYAPLDAGNPLARIAPWRRVMERLEPFLAGFWREDLVSRMQQHMRARFGRHAHVQQVRVQGGLYACWVFADGRQGHGLPPSGPSFTLADSKNRALR